MHTIGDPQDSVRVVHIAGTSGKTSTAYYTAALLQGQDYKVGLSVSPHIDTVAERAQINGTILSEEYYCLALTEFLQLVQKSHETLSYYEVLVAFMYWEFARQKVDYAVIETGLGGLLDGTNIVHRADKVAVITDIGMDHMEILGDSLAKIAAQKAGIIMEDGHVFMQKQSDDITQVVRRIAHSKKATVHTINPKSVSYPLMPSFQSRNLHLARSVVEYVIGCELSMHDIKASAKVYIPARMEVVQYKGKIVVLDGSHNQQKMHALVTGLRAQYGQQNISVLAAFGHNKRADIMDTLQELKSVSTDMIFTTFTHQQDEVRHAIDPQELGALWGSQPVAIADPQQAFGELLACDSPVLLVTGSYFLLHHIRPLMGLTYSQKS